MASNLIDQPTVGAAPRMSQGPVTPITSVGSGATGVTNPTFSAHGTISPFTTAGPLLGGLVGAILANREAANASAATRESTATGGTGSAGKSATATAGKAIKDALSKSTSPTHPDGADSQGNIWLNGELVKIPSAGLTKFGGKWYDVNGNLVDYSVTDPTQNIPDANYYDSEGNLIDPLTTPALSGLGALSGVQSDLPPTPIAIRQPQTPASPALTLPDVLAGITASPPSNPLGDQIVQGVMPDYNKGIYQDAAGNIWSNGSLVYDGETGDYFSNNKWYNAKGDPYSLNNGASYDFSSTPDPYSGYSDTSFGSGGYDFSLPSENTPYSDLTAPSFDTGNYDFGFKDGGNVTMMKKGGLSQFAGGGAIHPTLSGGWADENGNPTDAYGNAYDPATGTYALAPATTTTASPADNTSSFTNTLFNHLPAGIMNYVNSAANNLGGTALGAGAGVALGSLLSGMTKGSGGVNQGLDMSQVGQIAPHTTNFGMGPARYVGYEDYGTQGGPDVYANSDLYDNLGTPKKKPSGLESLKKADGGSVHFTYGTPVNPMQIMQDDQGMQRMRDGGTPEALGHPEVAGRMDFRQGSYVNGPGDGQSDDIPAMLADGEYVFDADTVAALGNGSSKAGSKVLDKMRENIRAHKRSAPINKIPPPAKSPLAYLKGLK